MFVIAVAVLELLAFNSPTVWLSGLLCTDRQTDAQTDENSINAIHFVYVAEININSSKFKRFHAFGDSTLRRSPMALENILSIGFDLLLGL